MSERFTVLIADFLDETTIESAVLGDIAGFVMAGATDESQLAPYLAAADAIMLFHDLTMLGEATFARRPGAAGWSARGLGTITWTARPPVDMAWWSATCPITAPRRWRTTRSCSSWRSSGGWSLRTRRSARAPGTTGPPSAPPGCAARRSGSWAAAGSGRRRHFGPRRLGLDVVFYDPYLRQGMDKALGIRRVHRLEELLEQSHFVSLHCYLDAASHHLINARTIAQMRRGAILINTARGPVVEEAALLEALESGHIAAAGLDVVEREPLQNEGLRQHPNVLFTPHTAFYSVEGYTELRTKTAEEVRRLLLGEPPRNPVNVIAGRV